MNTPSNPADDSYWTIPRPDWAQWERRRKAKLWQAVALLCELEPTRLEIGPGILNTVFIHTPPKFHTVLGLAKTGIGAGLLTPDKLDPEHLEESEIDLTIFASWANAKVLPFPEGFPWQPEMNLQVTGWPWGRHETDLLRKLARAADIFWKNYQPGQPSTAPTNEQVTEWLVKQDVARRTAEIMATILRADGLPTGPRK
ncbi:hypothetical protein [Thiobacillus denitrificans]|uniref:hypothetical protein n=1 Tax=Thiobacillus denitrificans TaxID=36861 RepID=UPI00037A39E7|nr:hypothetical protein [Thiobacillus denitrificans]